MPNQYAQTLEDEAMSALLTAGAIKYCRFHDDVWIRVGDDNAERKAYAVATNRLKQDTPVADRQDLLDAIKDALDMAAEYECPSCEALRDA